MTFQRLDWDVYAKEVLTKSLLDAIEIATKLGWPEIDANDPEFRMRFPTARHFMPPRKYMRGGKILTKEVRNWLEKRDHAAMSLRMSLALIEPYELDAKRSEDMELTVIIFRHLNDAVEFELTFGGV